jgi:nucleotide-binding universal stress UspA family protein
MVYGMYSQILVPLDGSDLAEQAIPQAEGLARSFHATLHLVQVFSVPRELVSVLEVGIGMPSPLDPNLIDEVIKCHTISVWHEDNFN